MIKIGKYRFNKEDILYYEYYDFLGDYVTFYFRNGSELKIDFTNREFGKEKMIEIDRIFEVEKVY